MRQTKHTDALVEIFEMAKCHRDLAFQDYDRERWDAILAIAKKALGNPTVADLQRLKSGVKSDAFRVN